MFSLLHSYTIKCYIFIDIEILILVKDRYLEKLKRFKIFRFINVYIYSEILFIYNIKHLSNLKRDILNEFEYLIKFVSVMHLVLN